MIEDARVLEPEFVPSEVQYRDQEVEQLATALNPLVRGEPADTAFLWGPTGTGKTCIAQFTVHRLADAVVPLNYQCINCWADHSRFNALVRILEGIEQTLDIHRQSTPRDVLLNRLREYDGPPYVVILDEVDQLDDKSLLYDLYRLRDVYLILIANRDTELFAELDSRLQSRLQCCVRVEFDRYGSDELVAILRDRVRWGLGEDATSMECLEDIADAAAGDARVAIGILRNAARQAEDESMHQITRSHIQSVVSETKSEIRQRTLSSLNRDQRVLYEIITDTEEIGPGDLYKRYEKRVPDPKSQRMVRNYLSKLQHYNLIRAEGVAQKRTYSPLS